MKFKFFLFIFIFIFILIFLAGCSSNNKITGDAVVEPITIYKSSSCGCCSLYSNYMKGKGFNVAEINPTNIYEIKNKYKIPSQLESCHTSIIGNYFAEGHIPLEAIKKMMDEKPDILGIAMPGMPSGAPGMPGGKLEPFVIYAVNKDGSYGEFMRM